MYYSYYYITSKSQLLLALLVLTGALALVALFFPPSLAIDEINAEAATKRIHVQKHFQFQIARSSCQGTIYTELCVSTVSAVPDLRSKSIPEIISHIVNTTLLEVRDSSSNFSGIRKKLLNLDPLDRQALDDCLELLADTLAQLKAAIFDLSSTESSSQNKRDLQTLFSGAMTNQYTCLDGFAYSKKNIRHYLEGRLRKISHHVSNSLAMLKKVKKSKSSSSLQVFPEYGTVKNGYPAWLRRRDRALLQASANQIKFDLIVAKDGSGNFTTINEALRAAPDNSKARFVIRIKAGAYFEYVEVDRAKTMIMFVGDGIGKTLIKGNRSVVDGWTTFRSATVGEFFIPSSRLNASLLSTMPPSLALLTFKSNTIQSLMKMS